MAEEDIESTSTTSSSFDDEDEDTDEDEQQQIAQLLQRPARVQQQQNNQQQLDDNEDDRILVFAKRYIDQFEDYLQISFPINKQIYQRAIIWIHYLNVKPKQSKSQQTNIKQKSSGIFSLFGSGNKTKWTGKHYNKYKYKYEKLCENVMVDQFKFESNDSIIGNDATY
eukprot:238035_1